MADEIRFALFGEAGAGKSAFISSFYGNLSSSDFLKQNAYCVRCSDPKVRNQLESSFNKMRDHKIFPVGTTKASKFSLSLKSEGYDNSELTIRLSDYPGGWWNDASPEDESERKARKSELKDLLFSHVGIILIDGQKYSSESTLYIREVFARYNASFKALINESKSIFGLSGNVLPETWIIAITKSDLFDEKQNAKWIREVIVRDALKELHDLQDTLGQHFGDNIILSSAVKASGDRVLNAHDYLGLELFAPIGLDSYIATASEPGFFDNARSTLSKALELLDEYIDVIPIDLPIDRAKHLVGVIKAAKKMGLLEMAKESVKSGVEAQAEKIDYFESILARVMAHLADESLSRLHFRAE